MGFARSKLTNQVVQQNLLAGALLMISASRSLGRALRIGPWGGVQGPGKKKSGADLRVKNFSTEQRGDHRGNTEPEQVRKSRKRKTSVWLVMSRMLWNPVQLGCLVLIGEQEILAYETEKSQSATKGHSHHSKETGRDSGVKRVKINEKKQGTAGENESGENLGEGGMRRRNTAEQDA